MIEFGKTLRLAREAKGLTIDDVAEMTRIMPHTIANMEREIFTDIIAPIYGRGFVKLYCEAVGIDHRPMVEEFMEIYNGNREAVIIERTSPQSGESAAISPSPATEPLAPTEPATDPLTVGSAPESEPSIPPAPAADPAIEPATPTTQEDLFALEGESITAREPPPRTPLRFPAPDAPFSPGELDPIAAAQNYNAALADEAGKKTSAKPTYSRYSSPLDNHPEVRPRFKIPAINPAVWRIGLVATGAILLLWLVITGIRALYRATMPEVPKAETAISAPADPGADAKGGVAPSSGNRTSGRKEVNLPPLYIDGNQ
jgi:transcriptional regulator with XRE-family HTH domain